MGQEFLAPSLHPQYNFKFISSPPPNLPPSPSPQVIDTRTTSVVVFHALPAATVAEQARLLAPVVQFFYVSPQYFAKVRPTWGLSSVAERNKETERNGPAKFTRLPENTRFFL